MKVSETPSEVSGITVDITVDHGCVTLLFVLESLFLFSLITVCLRKCLMSFSLFKQIQSYKCSCGTHTHIHACVYV